MIMQIKCLLLCSLVLSFRRWTGLCLSSRLMVKSCTFQKQLRYIWVCHRWEFNLKPGSVQGHSDNTLQHTHNRHNVIILSGECEVNSCTLLFAPYPHLCFYWEIQSSLKSEITLGFCLFKMFRFCIWECKETQHIQIVCVFEGKPV